MQFSVGKYSYNLAASLHRAITSHSDVESMFNPWRVGNPVEAMLLRLESILRWARDAGMSKSTEDVRHADSQREVTSDDHSDNGSVQSLRSRYVRAVRCTSDGFCDDGESPHHRDEDERWKA